MMWLDKYLKNTNKEDKKLSKYKILKCKTLKAEN